MDQEREKLARETAEKMIAECEVVMVGGCPACPGYHPENRCPACVNDAATIARLIDTALEQWGDLRAEQVRRDRDMEWWEAIVLVDNVAPEPAAAKQWLLNLAACEREQVRRETVEVLAGALCAGCAQELPLHDSIDGTRGYHTYPKGWKGIRVEPYHCSGYEVRRAFAASQGGKP